MRLTRWLNGSVYTGSLPKGCVHCARGGKLVLLVTGKCYSGCYYCPLSFKKKGKGAVYADEKRIGSDEEILEEGDLIRATGTGITGGDPLLNPAETARLIRLLKEHYGARHHIHLYTSTVSIPAIRKLAGSGLDEIRFHPPIGEWPNLSESKFSSAISESKKQGMDAGFEIPSIPKLKAEMCSFVMSADEMGADFVNLNELEFSESNWRALKSRGFSVKDDISAAVKGSERAAIDIIRKTEATIPLHYCSSSFKDGIQLRRRIMRRGRSVRRPFDVLTEDGTLIFGIIESRNPGRMAERLRKEFGVPKALFELNSGFRRIEIASWVLQEIAGELGEDAYIIEEYPTADRLEVEREQISARRR